MPYNNRDPKRNNNFDNHPHRATWRVRKALNSAGELQGSHVYGLRLKVLKLLHDATAKPECLMLHDNCKHARQEVTSKVCGLWLSRLEFGLRDLTIKLA